MIKKIKNFIKKIIYLTREKKIVAVPVPVNTNKILANKIALITGGSSGIGYSMAEAFINSGCKVIIAGTNEEKLKLCCEQLGENSACIKIDIRNVEDIPDGIEKASSLFEENRIDILVNSAGVVNKDSFLDMTETEYDTIMDINTKGTYFMCQYMSKYMIEKKIKGHILNVTSSSALRPAWTPYQMSKWAIKGFTLGLADQLLPHGIIVNAIAPGPVATPMLDKNENDNIYLKGQPSERYAVPSEIANLAVFM